MSDTESLASESTAAEPSADGVSGAHDAAMAALIAGMVEARPSSGEASEEATEGDDAPSEPAKKGEPEVEKKDEPKLSRAFAALERKRARNRAERAELAQTRALIEQQSRQVQETLAQAQQTAKEASRLQALAKSDPIAFFAETGLSVRDVTTEMIRRDTPDAKVEALAAELRAMKEAEARRAQEATKAQQAAAYQAQIKAEEQMVFDATKEAAATHPYASKVAAKAPEKYRQQMHAAAQWLRANGYTDDVKNVARYLDNYYRDIAESFAEQHESASSTDANAGDAPAAGKPKAPAPRAQSSTLKNADAAQGGKSRSSEDEQKRKEAEAVERWRREALGYSDA